MEQLFKEEQRHIKEELTEEELEIFDLLLPKSILHRKRKLAAKELYNTLLSKKKDLFVVGWQVTRS